MGVMPGALVVFGGSSQSWLPSLEQAGWVCHRCYDLRAAESLLLDIGPCIGVVDLSKDDFSINGIATLVNRNKQVRWLAVVREEQLTSDAICQFIASFCIDYFTSPTPAAQLQETIGHQLGMLQLERKVWPDLGRFGQQGLQGTTEVMKRLRHQVQRIAANDVSVFIEGEMGTGKELVARAVHQASTRANNAFVRISCETVTADWFSDSNDEQHCDMNSSPCCFALADKGILYLDEISALSDQRQQELLQFIQDDTFTTTAGEKVTSDIRVIVSTSYPVEQLVAEGKLRQDLLYRLNVVTLVVPALRERGCDISLLAEFLLLKFARQYNSVAKHFSDEAQKMLITYPWPGNVRELISQVKRAVLLAEDKSIEADHLDIPRLNDDKQSLKTIREESERGALLTVLENNKGQISAAARELGVSRATMYRLLNKHDLVPAPRNFRDNP